MIDSDMVKMRCSILYGQSYFRLKIKEVVPPVGAFIVGEVSDATLVAFKIVPFPM